MEFWKDGRDLQKVPRHEGQITHEDFFVPFGGESDRQAGDRFSSEIDNILQNTDAKNILCVAHGGVLWLYYLRKVEKRNPEDSKYFGNCCVLEFDIDDNNKVTFANIYNPTVD